MRYFRSLKKFFILAREPEFDDVKKSLVQVSGTWDGRKWIKIPDTNLAHVYPYNAMAYVVQDALNKWPDPAKNDRDIDHEAPARLLAFLDWLFLIDPQAVVNAGFHNSVPMAVHILHSGISSGQLLVLVVFERKYTIPQNINIPATYLSRFA